jgi:Nif-specific regulatory protein
MARPLPSVKLIPRSLKSALYAPGRGGAAAFRGGGPAARDLRRQIEAAARSAAPVLLLGEPGSGRSLAARIIHRLSGRLEHPSVLDLELHPLGLPKLLAAGPSLRGRLLYLREIERLDADSQAALLRFIRAGPPEGFRLIASASPELPAMSASGAFNPDLFYLVEVLAIEVPPLRSRASDLPELIQALAPASGPPRFTDAALRRLANHHWPGNVRELAELLPRLALTCGDAAVDIEDLEPLLAPAHAPAPGPAPRKPSLRDLEKQEVLEALRRNNWVQRRAARDLGLTQRQIGYRVKKYGLDEIVARERGKGG